MDQLSRDIKKLQRKLNAISQKEMPKAISRSLNRMGPRIKRRTVNAIAKAEKLPAKPVRKKIFFKKSKPSMLEAASVAYVKPVNMIALIRKARAEQVAPRGTSRRGVKASGRSVRGAFINRGRSGNLQVFKRKGSARLPIEAVRIPISKTALRVAPTVVERVMKNDFPAELARDLDFRLKKYEDKT
ncbi:MAG: phage tail protein [Gammaproteobacteria bacterium]|nr:phage tail protein [Gammaproteobacteria bacterium]